MIFETNIKRTGEKCIYKVCKLIRNIATLIKLLVLKCLSAAGITFLDAITKNQITCSGAGKMFFFSNAWNDM